MPNGNVAYKPKLHRLRTSWQLPLCVSNLANVEMWIELTSTKRKVDAKQFFFNHKPQVAYLLV